MTIFEYLDYRDYLRGYIGGLPKAGRGELSKIASHLKVNTTLLSQILAGTRDFNHEQALELSRYLGHSEIETDYFFLLVQKDRAGTQNLKSYLEGKIKVIRAESLKLSKRIKSERVLNDRSRAVFYSSWLYSAVHLFSSTKEEGVTLDEITKRFDVTRARAREVTQFLSSVGLCNEKAGRITTGTQSTFVEQGSPFLLRHHSNWRIKAIQKSEAINEDELMYTGQVSLSKADFKKLREELADFLKRAMRVIRDSPAEEIASLNIDWFWINK